MIRSRPATRIAGAGRDRFPICRTASPAVSPVSFRSSQTCLVPIRPTGILSTSASRLPRRTRIGHTRKRTGLHRITANKTSRQGQGTDADMAPGFPHCADMADRITVSCRHTNIGTYPERPRTCHPFPSSRRGPHDAGTRTSAARGMQDIPPVPAQPGRNRPPCPAAFFPTSVRPMIFPCFFQGPDGEGADSVSRRMTGIPEVIGGTGHTTSIVRTNHRGSSGHSPFRICRVFPSASGMNAPAGRFSFRARQVFIQFRHANTVALGRSYMTQDRPSRPCQKKHKGACLLRVGRNRPSSRPGKRPARRIRRGDSRPPAGRTAPYSTCHRDGKPGAPGSLRRKHETAGHARRPRAMHRDPRTWKP